MADTTATLADYGTLIYKNIHGSHAQGTNYGTDMFGNVLPGYESDPRLSDVDVTGIFVPHKKLILGTRRQFLYPEFEHFDEWSDPENKDNKYLSLPKFARRLYECNPNITEQLFVRPDHILFCNEFGLELLNMRHLFITKQSFERFASYARHQILLMDRGHNNNSRGKASAHIHYYELSGEENFDLKAFAHLLRLMFQCREMLSEGTLSTYLREPDRLACIRVKHFGFHPWIEKKLTLQEAYQIADDLFAELQQLLLVTTLPTAPDFDILNNWVSDTIERVNGGVVLKQNYRLSGFQVLPFEHQMLEESTLLLVSNPLSPRKVRSEAYGVCLPYREFFTGLREFEQTTLGKTKIDSLHKALSRAESCNPTLIDAVFAGEEHQLVNPTVWSEELVTKLRSVITRDKLYQTTMGVIKGNLKEMHKWEKTKKEWEAEKQRISDAKILSTEDFEAKKSTLEEKRKKTISLFFAEGPSSTERMTSFLLQHEEEKRSLSKEIEHWHKTKEKKLTKYPPCPEGTDPENSSYMNRFGYDTVQAAFMYHVLSMAIELMNTGTMEDSRAYEGQMTLLKEGTDTTFDIFQARIHQMLAELESAKANSPLPQEINHHENEQWIIDFVDRYHSSLS